MYPKSRKALNFEKQQLKSIQERSRRLENYAVYSVLNVCWMECYHHWIYENHFSCLSSHDLLFQTVSLTVIWFIFTCGYIKSYFKPMLILVISMILFSALNDKCSISSSAHYIKIIKNNKIIIPNYFVIDYF